MKRILAFVLALLLLFSLGGCGESEGQTIYIALDKITTLDPQIVSRPADRTVVLNIYEGLFRLDENDTPILAAAKELYCTTLTSVLGLFLSNSLH